MDLIEALRELNRAREEHRKGVRPMNVSDAMTRAVQIASPDQTIQQAARLMASIDAGSLPVGDNDKLVGMITDRDIAIRAVADGKGPDTRVRDVMSKDVKYCFEDETVEAVSRKAAGRHPVAGRRRDHARQWPCRPGAQGHLAAGRRAQSALIVCEATPG